jgi:ATP-binding cassette subfamily B multidrug efflux pump
VIDRGRIAESGTHAELLHRRGLYYQLYMAQFKFLEAENKQCTMNN